MYSFTQKECLSSVPNMPKILRCWGYKDEPHTSPARGALSVEPAHVQPRRALAGQCVMTVAYSMFLKGLDDSLVEFCVYVGLLKRDSILASSPANSMPVCVCVCLRVTVMRSD